jgi:hypothetical protein
LNAQERLMTSKVEPHFDAIVALVADGVSVPKALKSRPEFPILATWKSYVYDARFPERRRRLEKAQSAGSLEGRSARYAEEIISLVKEGRTIGAALAANPKFPHPSKFRLYVIAHPELEQRLEAAKPNRSKMAPYFDEVRKRVDRGQSIVDALDALPNKPSKTCFRQFAGKSLEREQWLIGLKEIRSRRSSDFRTAPLVRNDKREQQLSRVLYSNDLYQRIAASVPKHIEASIRDDVITDVIVAVLSRKIGEDEIGAKVKQCSARYFREDRFRHRSLYAETFDDGTTTLLDTHSADNIQDWGL